MEKELPKIDLIDEDFAIGTGIKENILNLYKDYPCRLKAEIFVLCMGGSIDATINLSRQMVRKYDFVTLSPGSIIQLHKAEGDLQIYYMIFSSKFINEITIAKSIIDFLYIIKSAPVLSLPPKIAMIYLEFFTLLIKIDKINPNQNKEVLKCILLSILHRLKELYTSQKNEVLNNTASSRNEEICKTFAHLVIHHYSNERSVSFYAQKIGITPTHLSNTVKTVTGRTVIEIISEMVITDAKAQLKSTNQPINEISDSLNFANVSFFGKYFKRHVGIGPLQYRNS